MSVLHKKSIQDHKKKFLINVYYKLRLTWFLYDLFHWNSTRIQPTHPITVAYGFHSLGFLHPRVCAFHRWSIFWNRNVPIEWKLKQIRKVLSKKSQCKVRQFHRCHWTGSQAGIKITRKVSIKTFVTLPFANGFQIHPDSHDLICKPFAAD